MTERELLLKTTVEGYLALYVVTLGEHPAKYTAEQLAASYAGFISGMATAFSFGVRAGKTLAFDELLERLGALQGQCKKAFAELESAVDLVNTSRERARNRENN